MKRRWYIRSGSNHVCFRIPQPNAVKMDMSATPCYLSLTQGRHTLPPGRVSVWGALLRQRRRSAEPVHH